MTLILGFDTSGPHCAAALSDGEGILGQTLQDMGRGQAEHLMPMLEDLLAAHGKSWQDLTALAVGIGPGNFTGIRISVAAARGLALGLGIQSKGVSLFETTKSLSSSGQVAVPAPRDRYYLLDFDKETAPAMADSLPHGHAISTDYGPADHVAEMVRLAAQGNGQTPPAPLYVRPADAAPSKTPPPVILSNDA